MNNPNLTLITPMYNESPRIADNIMKIVSALEGIGVVWEYILVDDGSTDGSFDLAQEAIASHPNCRIIHYPCNRGRGHALRKGIDAARGDYVITTESDLTWGTDIIGTLYRSLVNTGDDMVIASTYLCDGGHMNVPIFRKGLSTYGNKVLRYCFNGKLTMLSGMTRGYRTEAIKALYLEEDDKAIHLEIVSKALLMGYRISEVPGRIHWPKEKSLMSLRDQMSMMYHVIPHLLVSLSEGGFKIISTISLGFFIFGTAVSVFGLFNKIFLLTNGPMPNLVIYGLIAITISVLSMLLAILSLQIIGNKRHLVHIQAQLKRLK